MIKKEYKIYSGALGHRMKVAVYGYFGFSLLLFPSTTDDLYENEKAGLIDALDEYIQKGRLRVFSVGSVNYQSWLHQEISNVERSKKHRQYNEFIVNDVVPFIFSKSEGPTPIITAGAAIGAYHAANIYFRRPDLFYGTIAMSGTYNIEHYTKDFFDDNCYFNSPVHYLPNMTDPYWLSFLRSKHHVYLLSGSGDNEYPGNSKHLSEILHSKNIKHNLDIWGDDCHHNFDTWNKMLSHIMKTKL